MGWRTLRWTAEAGTLATAHSSQKSRLGDEDWALGGDHILLILTYRQASFSDTRSIYPAKSRI